LTNRRNVWPPPPKTRRRRFLLQTAVMMIRQHKVMILTHKSIRDVKWLFNRCPRNLMSQEAVELALQLMSQEAVELALQLMSQEAVELALQWMSRVHQQHQQQTW
jgi:hypothetical protein